MLHKDTRASIVFCVHRAVGEGRVVSYLFLTSWRQRTRYRVFLENAPMFDSIFDTDIFKGFDGWSWDGGGLFDMFGGKKVEDETTRDCKIMEIIVGWTGRDGGCEISRRDVTVQYNDLFFS